MQENASQKSASKGVFRVKVYLHDHHGMVSNIIGISVSGKMVYLSCVRYLEMYHKSR